MYTDSPSAEHLGLALLRAGETADPGAAERRPG